MEYGKLHGKALAEGKSKSQIHLVHKVPEGVFDQIDKPGPTGARISYEYGTGDLIVKLMSTLEHDAAHLILVEAIRMRVIKMDIGTIPIQLAERRILGTHGVSKVIPTSSRCPSVGPKKTGQPWSWTGVLPRV